MDVEMMVVPGWVESISFFVDLDNSILSLSVLEPNLTLVRVLLLLLLVVYCPNSTY